MQNQEKSLLSDQGRTCPLRGGWISFRLVDEFGDAKPYAGMKCKSTRATHLVKLAASGSLKQRLKNMNLRQKYYTDNHYQALLKAYDKAEDFYRTRKFKSDSCEEEEMLRSRFFQRLALNKLLATYTAGEEISTLLPILEDLIEKYEIRQNKLAKKRTAP